ncbi:MAG: tryptophan synthase subunit alpha, partial [Spirochaetota bacterium]
YNGLYLMGNYPDADTFISAALKGLELFDFLEVGLPFSDPIADGEVIAEAAYTVIENGETFASICSSVETIRKARPDNDVYFMNYANTAHVHGFDTFCKKAKEAGVMGLIIPDIPFSESEPIRKAALENGLSYVDFLTVESTDAKSDELAGAGEGFLYAVSMRGITGQEASFAEGIENRILAAKQQTSRPVVMGFGIRDGATAKTALNSADGFIMGTVPIRELNRGIVSFNRFIDVLKDELNTSASV